jgi:hypothetical protein
MSQMTRNQSEVTGHHCCIYYFITLQNLLNLSYIHTLLYRKLVSKKVPKHLSYIYHFIS